MYLKKINKGAVNLSESENWWIMEMGQKEMTNKLEEALEKAEKERDRAKDEAVAARMQMEEILKRLGSVEAELTNKNNNVNGNINIVSKNNTATDCNLLY